MHWDIIISKQLSHIHFSISHAWQPHHITTRNIPTINANPIQKDPITSLLNEVLKIELAILIEVLTAWNFNSLNNILKYFHMNDMNNLYLQFLIK